jgi:hypothetical protein
MKVLRYIGFVFGLLVACSESSLPKPADPYATRFIPPGNWSNPVYGCPPGWSCKVSACVWWGLEVNATLEQIRQNCGVNLR